MRIGCHGDPFRLSGDRQIRGVIPLRQSVAFQVFAECLFDQIGGHFSAAAMPGHNPIICLNGGGAGESFRNVKPGHDFSGNDNKRNRSPRRRPSRLPKGVPACKKRQTRDIPVGFLNPAEWLRRCRRRIHGFPLP